MAELVNLARYKFVWHALSDACPICTDLNGKTYYNQDLNQNTLRDPVHGDVWNLYADHTLAHPNCRCQLEVLVLFKPTLLTEELGVLLQTLRELRVQLERRY